MSFVTCDICDANEGAVRVVTGLHWYSFGGRKAFSGQAVTVKCFEDNSRVKEILATDGHGKVLVVDGGASLRMALIGDMIGESAVKHGWSGVLIYGACRDVDELAKLDLGVVTLGSVPLKSVRRGEGQRDIPVAFGGVTITPGDYVYVDNNGVVVSETSLI
ncbi:MAG: ribonuclease activity regulator protein RraA [Gammaproteobacteria bacterium HGW-Gammaproteobacteria-14]|nr:MAG: ribonuclease activity regulator protein RraA [Gammaproteobacteria bacterium HGW-Gammaproteobacteria-14]